MHIFLQTSPKKVYKGMKYFCKNVKNLPLKVEVT